MLETIITARIKYDWDCPSCHRVIDPAEIGVDDSGEHLFYVKCHQFIDDGQNKLKRCDCEYTVRKREGK